MGNDPDKKPTSGLVLIVLGIVLFFIAVQDSIHPRPRGLLIFLGVGFITAGLAIRNPQFRKTGIARWFPGEVFLEDEEVYKARETIAAWKKALEINPDDAEAYVSLGKAYATLGRYEEAIAACKRAIQLEPDNAETYYGLAAAYRKLGKEQEAIKALNEAVKEAVKMLKEVIRLNPRDAEAHYNLGMVYLALGERGSAIDQWRILNTLDQDWAKRLLDELRK